MLVKTLFEEYGGFADKRIKNLSKSRLFIIDDRAKGDIGADKKLLSYFCMVSAEVLDEEFVKVTFRGNIPMGTEVFDWIERYGEDGGASTGHVLEITIRKGQQPRLQELAAAFRALVASPYSVPNWKYVCPRTASTLERLSKALNKEWQAKEMPR